MKSIYAIRLGKHRVAVLDLCECDYCKNAFLITRINVPAGYRNRGYGTALLEQCIADADYEHATLLLEVSPSGPMTYTQLVDWYERYGFFQVEDNLYKRESNGIISGKTASPGALQEPGRAS